MFSHQQFFALATLASCIATAFADEIAELPTTVVTAARIAQPEREVIGDVTVITRKQLDTRQGEMLSELLGSQSGVQITSNGGQGKDSSFFIRGTNSNQTLILIDGVRYGSATTGAATIQHLPLDQIDHIEILRGPAASLYGADAIGGVIQIFTRQGGNKEKLSLNAGIGTQRTREFSIQKSGSEEGLRYALGVAHHETDGINVLRDKSSDNYSADTDGYLNQSFSASLAKALNKNHEIGGSALLLQASSHYDSSVYDSSFLPSAQNYDYRERTENGALNLWSRNQFTSNWVSRIQAGISQDRATSYGPVSSSNLADKTTVFMTRQTQIGWLNQVDAGPGTATLGLETVGQSISGDAVYSVDHRRINGIYGGYLARLNPVTLQVNARSDRNSQLGEHSSGQLGASWQVRPALQVGANLGSAFKAPTFNDLYYPDDGYGNKGNPNVKPETAFNREAFIRFEKGNTKTSATFFDNKIKNLIAWAPVDPSNTWGAWQPSNIGRVHIKGASLTLDQQHKTLQWGGRYDWLDARDASGGSNDGKRLIRRARQTAGLYAGIKQEKWSARAELNAVGARYENAANTQRMGGYALSNFVASYQLAAEWQLSAKLNNAFNRTYEQARGYNTLGRNAMLNLRWEPKQ